MKSKHSISNGNRTEWSPIRSVIMRVINKYWSIERGLLVENWSFFKPISIEEIVIFMIRELIRDIDLFADVTELQTSCSNIQAFRSVIVKHGGQTGA